MTLILTVIVLSLIVLSLIGSFVCSLCEAALYAVTSTLILPDILQRLLPFVLKVQRSFGERDVFDGLDQSGSVGFVGR